MERVSTIFRNSAGQSSREVDIALGGEHKASQSQNQNWSGHDEPPTFLSAAPRHIPKHPGSP